MDSIFIRTLCTDRIKIRAGQMTRHFRKSILARLKEKYEGICSHHGYIRKNSIDIYKISPGEVLVHSLNGDIQYTVQYYADICNPTVGTSIRATVLNKNKFGLLAHVYDEAAGAAPGVASVRYPILEIIVPRDSMPEDVDFDKIAKGASITISVLGKKFANRDTKISVVGSLTHNHSILSGTSRDLTHDAVDANPLEDEEDDLVDLDNDEEDEEEDNNDGEDADEDAKSTQQNEEEEEDEEDFDEELEEDEEEDIEEDDDEDI